MKRFLVSIALTLMVSQSALAADARVTLPEFNGLESKAVETVSITLDSTLIKLAAGFLDANKPDEAAAREIISGLSGIYVRTFKFDADFNYPVADVERVRKQLVAPRWQRVVEVRSRKEQAAVDVYVSIERNMANGLAIIASEPREFTIVNIVGAVDLEKLHRLEGRLGVPKLELEVKKTRP
jgi:Domain of unknown function (DUF4252)